MGFAGAAYIMQELVNQFYEIVFNFLPVEQVRSTAQPAGAPTAPTSSATTMPWSEAATQRLTLAIEQVPFLARISASRTLRQAAEQSARTQGLAEVSLELVEVAIHQNG